MSTETPDQEFKFKYKYNPVHIRGGQWVAILNNYHIPTHWLRIDTITLIFIEKGQLIATAPGTLINNDDNWNAFIIATGDTGYLTQQMDKIIGKYEPSDYKNIELPTNTKPAPPPEPPIDNTPPPITGLEDLLNNIHSSTLQPTPQPSAPAAQAAETVEERINRVSRQVAEKRRSID